MVALLWVLGGHAAPRGGATCGTHSNTSPWEFRQARKKHEELWGCRKMSKLVWVGFGFEARSHSKAPPGLELTVA